MDNILSALNYLKPAEMDYDSWLRVGMALRNEGYPLSVWDEWSKNDSRYQAGVCEKKWKSFENGPACRVTGGSIVQMAKEAGWERRSEDGALAWDGVIEFDGPEKLRTEPASCETCSGADQLKAYLRALFQPEDIIGYVTNDVWKNEEGRYVPLKGVYNRKVSELLDSLEKYPDDLAYTVGDWKEECGAWIRINPLDGQGVKNENVAAFRYALVESDTMPLEEQENMYRRLALPIAALVYSGGKSLHAIVRIEAPNNEVYRERVQFLYSYLKTKGMEIDQANKNPSRLSRMPGATRNGKIQALKATNIGMPSWEAWERAISGEKASDGLPDFSEYDGVREHLPEQPEELIRGVLRKGHKMLISGASKAGKSFLLMELCVAIAEGRSWLGFECRKGKVLYINLEIDPASCLHRLADIYEAMEIPPENPQNIRIWNLRGKALPLNDLAPKLIRRVKDEGFSAIILDPIYKVITGDENNATDMGRFCNEFDRIAEETGCSMIYCHHHSKGVQGFKKAQDRASGSGVFSRDPDAQLDIIELVLPDDQKDLTAHYGATAWRLEGSLREFSRFAPVNFWFEYPIHRVDNESLEGKYAEGSPGANLSKSSRRTTKKERKEKLDLAYEAVSFGGGIVKVKDLADYEKCSSKTIIRALKEFDDCYQYENGVVQRIAS